MRGLVAVGGAERSGGAFPLRPVPFRRWVRRAGSPLPAPGPARARIPAWPGPPPLAPVVRGPAACGRPLGPGWAAGNGCCCPSPLLRGGVGGREGRPFHGGRMGRGYDRPSWVFTKSSSSCCHVWAFSKRASLLGRKLSSEYRGDFGTFQKPSSGSSAPRRLPASGYPTITYEVFGGSHHKKLKMAILHKSFLEAAVTPEQPGRLEERRL